MLTLASAVLASAVSVQRLTASHQSHWPSPCICYAGKMPTKHQTAEPRASAYYTIEPLFSKPSVYLLTLFLSSSRAKLVVSCVKLTTSYCLLPRQSGFFYFLKFVACIYNVKNGSKIIEQLSHPQPETR